MSERTELPVREERCETCYFFQPWTHYEKSIGEPEGGCHRFPKVEKKLKRGWCGEWKAKDGAPPLCEQCRKALPKTKNGGQSRAKLCKVCHFKKWEKSQPAAKKRERWKKAKQSERQRKAKTKAGPPDAPTPS